MVAPPLECDALEGGAAAREDRGALRPTRARARGRDYTGGIDWNVQLMSMPSCFMRYQRA
jgi:hypothetical protein